ncbi:MAG: glycosyltransferase [Lachnospiraceae bacterium]|nr:glycosyltransferase [Lachnospiraceae bacterium]
MKNIAIITTSLNGGGAERIAGLLSKELSKKYNVYLFLMNTENIIYEYGGTIVNIGYSGPFYEYAIKVYKEKYDINVSISFLEIMNFANIRTRGKERVIISERSVQSLCTPFLYSEAEKISRYYNYADEIVACSYGVKYDLEESYKIKNDISVVYNFINKENIAKKSLENINNEILDFLDGSDFFLNVGRLHEQKNQERLINQFSFFVRKQPNYKLIILGSGELKTRLENQIKKLGLVEKVRVVSYMSNPFSYMKKAKALILSSHYEGLPNVLLEAMTIGLPIIATDCLAGPRELLNDERDYGVIYKKNRIGKRGILIPDVLSENDGTTSFMAEAMETIIQNREYCELFVTNQKAYIEEYANELILNNWIKLIEKSNIKSSNVLNDEDQRLDKAKKIYIYGAGKVGKTFYIRLSKKYDINGFVVTRKEEDSSLFGVSIYDIDSLHDDFKDSAFIIGVSDNYQSDVIKKLKEKGIDNYVYPFVCPCTYDYYISNCNNLNIREELIDWYRSVTGREIAIDNPKTFNEKIQWLKLYDSNKIKTTLADKLTVREYVKTKIGVEYLIPIIGVWDKYEDINFDELPNKFALKCNTGSGTNIIVKEKATMNHKSNALRFDEWQKIKYEYMSGLEMHYSGMKSYVYAEELLETENGEDLFDYKVFVFNGKVKLIQVDIDRHHNHRRNLYTTDWEYLPYTILYSTDPNYIIEKPACLDELINIAEILGKDFIHVRVDFYICKNHIYFGEMTFSHGSGTEVFIPEKFGYQMGEWMKLEKTK